MNIGAICDSGVADVHPRLFTLALGPLLHRLDVAEDVFLDLMQEEPRPRSGNRVGRHQLRVREALVDVFVDDVRLVQHRVALDQHRRPVVGIDHREVFRLVIDVHVDDLEVHALLVQHDPAALAERVRSS
jgi:hypothetical protein